MALFKMPVRRLTPIPGQGLVRLWLISCLLGGLVLAALPAPVALAAPTSRQGTEFRVNVNTDASQRTYPETPQAVAMNPAGQFVVAWASIGQAGISSDVFYQVYNAQGVALAPDSDFQANTFTNNEQEEAVVAIDNAGNFVLAWISSNEDTPDSRGIYARRFDAQGVPKAAVFRVNTTTASEQDYPTIAMDGAGNFVISWSSFKQDVPGVNNFGVYFQRYNALGEPQGVETPVNTTTAGSQLYSNIAMNRTNGNFVLTWSSESSSDVGKYDVFARRYNANGTPQSGEAVVSNALDNQRNSTVGMADNGSYVVTWSSDLSGNYEVLARRYNANGTAVAAEFAVNTFTPGEQRFSSIAVNGAGSFAISWSSSGQDDVDGLFGVYGRFYDAAGVAFGGEFPVNTFTANNQRYSSTAIDSAGNFVVVWNSFGQDRPDRPTGGGIYGQRFGNSKPIALNDNYTTLPDTTLNVAAPGVLSNDSDADQEDTLKAIKLTNPAHGTLTFNDNGSFIYVPVTGYSGLDSFTYKASDSYADSAVATVTISVGNGWVVTIGPDDGTGDIANTFSWALKKANTTNTKLITFASNITTVTFTAALAAPLTIGENVKITGGTCPTPANPMARVTINGAGGGLIANSLTITGKGVELRGLEVIGFSGPQIKVAEGGSAKMFCVKASKS